jgi:hypothetical protein
MPNLDSVGCLPARATDDRSGIIPACAGLGARASRPHAWERRHCARMPGCAGVAPAGSAAWVRRRCACAGLGARASRPHAWVRGCRACMPGCAGAAPACLGARVSRLHAWVRGRRARRHGRVGVAPAGSAAWVRGYRARRHGRVGVAPAGSAAWVRGRRARRHGRVGVAPAGSAAWVRGRRARRHGRVGVAPAGSAAWVRGRPARMQQCDTLRERGYMVFEKLFRSSPRRRASPCLAEGFSPTARGAYRIITFLAKFEPNWTGLNIPRVAPHAMTEIHFGLLSAGSDRLARHGRPRQGSMYLRIAINSQSPSALGCPQSGMFP